MFFFFGSTLLAGHERGLYLFNLVEMLLSFFFFFFACCWGRLKEPHMSNIFLTHKRATYHTPQFCPTPNFLHEGTKKHSRHTHHGPPSVPFRVTRGRTCRRPGGPRSRPPSGRRHCPHAVAAASGGPKRQEPLTHLSRALSPSLSLAVSPPPSPPPARNDGGQPDQPLLGPDLACRRFGCSRPAAGLLRRF